MKLLSFVALRFHRFLPLVLTASLAAAQSPQKPPVSASYDKLPLSFEANQGQTDPSVQFLAHGQGYTLFLRHGEAVLALRGLVANPAQLSPQTSLLRMALVASKPGPAVTGEDQQITRSNYFLGKNPTRWRTDIPNYTRVRYQSVYDGIDLVYYGRQRLLEHDFTVAPNADPTQIVLAFDGQQQIAVDPATGDLVLKTAQGSLRLLKPVTYQQSGPSSSRRTQIASSYKLLRGNKIGFSIGHYNHAQPLIIDPVLVYSTYLGGSGTAFNGANSGDHGNGITVDSDGDAYVVGDTSSIDFPVTTGAYKTKNKAALAGNGSNAFVAKFNATGSALIYSTFLGGSGEDSFVYGPSDGEVADAVAIDSAGNAYVTGWTKSADFPVTTGAFQAVNKSFPNGTASAFVTKLNATGDALVYSTYLGGTLPNECFGYLFGAGQAGTAIAVDGQGSAYVAGGTSAPDFPVTPGAFQTTYPASGINAPNGFVTKFSPDGSSLAYSTYLGGSGSGALCYVQGDEAYGLAIDSAGDAFVAGGTVSTDFPVTASALKTVNVGGNGFVTKLNPTGSAEIYSTYLGGTGQDSLNGTSGDYVKALVVDSAGNAYLEGAALSSDFPVTSGAAFSTVSTSGDSPGFVAKLNAAGSALEYSTLLPGTSAGLAVDSSGSAYVTGGTWGFPFPTTPDAVVQYTPLDQATPYVGFVAKLNSTATALEFATMLGSPAALNSAVGSAVALDSTGNLYVTGYTSENDFPVTSGALQTQNAAAGHGFGTGNAFVSKLALAGDTVGHAPTSTTVTASSTLVNQGQPITLTATVTGKAGTATPTGPITFGVGAGSYTDTATLSPSGVANWTSTTLPPGAYLASAFYQGDATHLSSSVGGPLAGSATTFRIVGPPAILTGGSYGGTNPIYVYGRPFSGLFLFVEDSSGYGLGGVQVNFSGPGLTFNCSCISASDGWVYAVPFANTVGNLVATASVSGLSTTLSYPITVVPGVLTVGMQSNSRQYGAPNPPLTYILSGLANGDTVTVTPSTTATPASPVGTYPVTASVTGPATANYNITVRDSLLKVTPATLAVWASPATQGSLYGSPVVLSSGFTFTGFLNGDTQATALTGAPIQSTTATPTSPVGNYPINLSLGTLTAQNYTFNFRGGRYYIYRPPLTLTATSFTINQGQPIPALTYSFTGFVNGQTAAVVSGAPNLSTTATAASKPGKYPITITQGSLSAQNYGFVPVNGQLTIASSANLSFNPASVSFPTTALGTTTAPMNVTVSNTSTTLPITVASYKIVGTNANEFSLLRTSCTSSLAASASCTLTVNFTPSTFGAASASLVVTDNAAGSPQSILLSGFSAPPPNISILPASLTFGATKVEGTSSIQMLTITNISTTTPMSVHSYTFSGADPNDFFIIARTCGDTLAPSSSCTISIAFHPTAAGARTANFVATDNAAASPQSIPLSGTAN